MITKKEPVTGKVAVWALPASKWELQNNPKAEVFKYVLATGDRWEQGAVKVQEYEISVVVPAGIDLLQRAVATLMEQKDKVLGEAQRQATEIQQQINQLLLLSGPKKEEFIDGEFLGAEPVEVSGGTQGTPYDPDGE